MEIRILATTDVHGYLEEGISDLIHNRDNFKSDFLIDNGDFFIGSPYATYLNGQSNQSPLVDLANQLDYDWMVMGNHDLDYGIEWLKEQVSLLSMPYLAANVLDRDYKLIFQAYGIKEVKGKKIACIGLLNQECRETMPLQYLTQVIIEDPIKSLKRILNEIEDKVDYIIVAYHGGLIQDPITKRQWTYYSSADQAGEILDNCPNLTALIIGHQHFTYKCRLDDGRVIVQPGSRGQKLGQVIIKNNTNQVDILELDPKPLSASETKVYHDWLGEKLAIDEEVIKEDLLKLFPADYCRIDIEGLSRKELLNLCQEPFSLAIYVLTREELMDNLMDDLDIHKIIFGKKFEKKRYFKILTFAGQMPDYYCRQKIIFPLFDYLNNYDKYHLD